MSTFPTPPRLLKGGVVLLDPESSEVRRLIALQYNLDTLTLPSQSAGLESGNRSIKPAAEINAVQRRYRNR